MKIRNILVLALMAFSVAGCGYDDDDLWNKVNSLDDRVTSIEDKQKTMNNDITALSTVINAVQNKVYVDKVEYTADGYVITFTDGTKATIANGKNGTNGTNGTNGADGKDGKDAPVIGVGQDGGKYYWTQTIDGKTSWLADAAGNKIPVTGADAVTPQLKVDSNGYWIISYDNGTTFTKVLDEAGRPVTAVGKDGVDGSDGSNGNNGDSYFDNVYIENDELVLVLSSDGSEIRIPLNTTGIPSDSKAEANPTIPEEEQTTVLPNISAPMLEEGSDGKVMTFTMTGIPKEDEEDGWLKLYGTGEKDQNIWMEIDGKPKGFVVINGQDIVKSRATAPSIARADVVFLVDNSGSMYEEANQVAKEIVSWSQTLSRRMDVKFGCVGIDHRYVNGALNITDVTELDAYLNRSGVTGINRTRGFVGSDGNELKTKASTYLNAGGECGGIMLRFADENFSFRPGANRIYVYLTDEPNQPNNIEAYSVESLNPESTFYNWGPARGTIHTVFSEIESMYEHSWTPANLRNEKPWLMSEYTGGTNLFVPSSFIGVTLDSLPVTGAILYSFTIRFNVTADLLTGTHTVKITIYTKDGKIKAEKTYKDVTFIAS